MIQFSVLCLSASIIKALGVDGERDLSNYSWLTQVSYKLPRKLPVWRTDTSACNLKRGKI